VRQNLAPGAGFDLGDVADRAAGADQQLVGFELRDPCLAQQLRDMGAQPADFVRGRRIGLEKTVADTQRSERQRPGLQ
jgi:hypothetical protein